MAVIVKQKAPTAAVAVKDGTYKAELTGIRQFANTYGARIGFEFTIEGGAHDGTKVMRSTAPQLTAQSRLAEVLAGLLGRELTPEELRGGIDLEQFIGIKCSILVLQSRSKTGAVFSNVERVFNAE